MAYLKAPCLAVHCNAKIIAMCQCFVRVGKKDQAVEMYRKGIDALQKGIAVEVNYGHGKRSLLSPASNNGLWFNSIPQKRHENLSAIKEN